MTGLLVVGLCGAFVAGAVVYRVMMALVMAWSSRDVARLDPETFAMLAVRRLRKSGASEDTILAFGQAIWALLHRPEPPDAE